MKMTMLLLGIVLLHLAVQAQYKPPRDLEKLLGNTNNFWEKVNITENYYHKALISASDSNAISNIERQLKLFERWKRYQKTRLEPDGTIGNAMMHVMDAHNAMEANPTPALQSSHANWRAMGPTRYNKLAGQTPGMGRVNCVAFSPTDPDLLYAGTANGGLWRREPNGNWTPLTDHLPSASISGVVVNYQNGNDIWILTGDGDSGGSQGMLSAGVFESHDGGISWKKSGNFPGLAWYTYTGYKLVQDPQSPSVFFACTDKGLFRSEDYCSNWVQVGNRFTYKVNENGKVVEKSAFNIYSDLVFKPGDHNTVYTTTMTGERRFRKSTDNGKTWIEISGGIGMDTSSRMAIGVTPAQPNWVYLLCGPAKAVGSYNGIYGSVTSGDWFIQNGNMPNILGGDINGQDNRDQSTYDLAIAVDPQNGTHVITGGIDIWASQNGGTQMTKRTHWDLGSIVQGSVTYGYVHADIHNLTYHGNRLYACTDGGLAVSHDHGITWTPLWNGLNILQSYQIAGIETDENHWLLGTQDNGTMYRNNSGMVVQHVGGGDGNGVIIHPDNVNIIWFAGTSNYMYSINGGVTNTVVPLPERTSKAWPLLTHNVNNVNEQLIGLPEGIYKFYPASNTISKRVAAGNSALINCPSNANRFFAAQDTVLYRSDDAGESWVKLTTKPGFPAKRNVITDVAVSPFNAGYVVLTMGGYNWDAKVFLSTNGGESWTNISETLPNIATLSVAVGPNGNIYVGNELGVYFKKSAAEPWMPFYTGLPKCPVNDMVVHLNSGKLRAATYGRGVWETELYSPCAAEITIAGEARGSYYYESSASITSTQLIAGGTGTTVHYKSAGNISLKEGMEVKHGAQGTYFKAYLGPCGTNISQLGTDSVVSQGIRLPEELNTGRYPPLKEGAYWRLQDGYLEYHLPEYAKISIEQIHPGGSTSFLLAEMLHAKGFFRMKTNEASGEFIRVKVNDTLLKETQKQPLF